MSHIIKIPSDPNLNLIFLGLKNLYIEKSFLSMKIVYIKSPGHYYFENLPIF